MTRKKSKKEAKDWVRIGIRVKKSEKAEYEAEAARQEVSVTRFIRSSMKLAQREYETQRALKETAPEEV